jgi:CheY-like chemotaxis protein
MKDLFSSSGKKPISTLKDHYRILLVDDEPDIVHVLKHGLENKGFQVDGHNSPEDAIQSFKPHVYDLAILDIRMPVLNGFALYKQMKKIDPSLTACFLSAFEIHSDEFKKVFPSMSEGIKAIIKKPVTITELVHQITPFLKISAQARAGQGEHVLVVYDSPLEMIEQSLEFLQSGIIDNEDVMFVTDVMPIDSIRGKISREWKGVDLDIMEQEGRITLHTFGEWYMPDGKFDLPNAINNLKKKVQQTSEHGRKGFRSVGDMNPFFDMGMTEEAVMYENMLDKSFDLPLISFCAYAKDRFHRLEDATVQLLYQRHNRIIGANPKR